MNMRGRFIINGDGRCGFRSVLPRHYSIPGDFRKREDKTEAERLCFGDVPFYGEVASDFALTPSTGRKAFVDQV